MTTNDTMFADLRRLAENARSQDKTWWLWDDEKTIEYGPMLAFAHAATPEAVRELLDELDRLREQVNTGRSHREALEGLPEGTLPRV